MKSLYELQEIVAGFWEKLDEIWQHGSKVPKVQLMDLGTTGGKAYRNINTIVLNHHFLDDPINEKHMLEQTIPHELAHLVTWLCFPSAKQAHGPEFRQVLGSISWNTSTHHKMDLTEVKKLSTQVKTKKRYVYVCDCPEKKHLMTPVAHNRIKKGWTYRCRKCKQPIRFAGDVFLPDKGHM